MTPTGYIWRAPSPPPYPYLFPLYCSTQTHTPIYHIYLHILPQLPTPTSLPITLYIPPLDARDPGKSADEFRKSPISCYLSYLRARDLSKIDPNPSLAPVRPRGGSGGAWESLGGVLRSLAEQPGSHGQGAKNKK